MNLTYFSALFLLLFLPLTYSCKTKQQKYSPSKSPEMLDFFQEEFTENVVSIQMEGDTATIAFSQHAAIFSISPENKDYQVILTIIQDALKKQKKVTVKTYLNKIISATDVK